MLEINKIVVQQGNFMLQADLSIKSGERVAIIGPSGGGKSTLLLALSGFLKLNSGSILLNGQIISGRNPAEMPCSILFQDNNLFPHMSVMENVGLGLKPTLKFNSVERKRIMEVLRKVGLQKKISSKPAELSGGQLTRAAIARSLLRQKSILMLDEPFSALGPAQRVDMLELLKEFLNRFDSILLIVSHEPGDIREIATRIIFVDSGVVSKPVDTGTFFNNPNPAAKKYLGGK